MGLGILILEGFAPVLLGPDPETLGISLATLACGNVASANVLGMATALALGHLMMIPESWVM